MQFTLLLLSFAFSFSLLSCSSTDRESEVVIHDDIVQEAEVQNFGPQLEQPSRIHFIDRTKEFGLEGVEGTHLYAVDFDGDGHTDLVVLPRFYSTPEFYRFVPEKGKFKQLDYSPFMETVRASYLAFFDLNRNGTFDIIMGTLNQRAPLRPERLRFFEGRVDSEGRVHYVYRHDAEYPLKELPTASIAISDVNLNGHLDIYLANWFDMSQDSPQPVADNILLASPELGDFSFSDISGALANEAGGPVPSFGLKACDLDQDGYPDFLVSASSGHANRLWMNRSGTDSFERFYVDYGQVSNFDQDDEGELMPRGGGHSFYSACTDYNNNQIFDLALGELTLSYDPMTRDRSSILTGNFTGKTPEFIRSEYYMDDGTGNWTQADRRGVFFDYNINGLADLLVENSGYPPQTRLILFEQAYDHSYADVALELGIDIVNPSGSVVLDINQNGLQDIIVGQTNIRNANIKTRLYVFENVTPRQNKRSLQVYFGGIQSNLQGIGATARLNTERWSNVRYHQPLYGPLPSQNAQGLHYGLGENNLPISIEVIWPYRPDGSDVHKQTYDLTNLFSIDPDAKELHQIITLCEDGRLKLGLQQCYL